MNSIRHQLDELHALDSREEEEQVEETTDLAEQEADADEANAPKEEPDDPELPSPPEVESQSLDQPEAPSVTVDELSDPVETLPEGTVEEPSPIEPDDTPEINVDTVEPVVEQSVEGLIDEPSIPAGGEVDQSSLSLSGDDDVPSPPVLDAPEDDPVEEENTQPPEPEVPQQDADFGLPNDSDDQETALDDMTSPDASVADYSAPQPGEAKVNANDGNGLSTETQIADQMKSNDDFAAQLLQKVGPLFDDVRHYQEQTTMDIMQDQILRTTLLGRVY